MKWLAPISAIVLAAACSSQSPPMSSSPDAHGADAAGPDAAGPDAAAPDAGVRCTPGGDGSYTSAPFDKLADYCLVEIREGKIQLLAGLPYDLNTPLFSDYAQKERGVWIPNGQSATYTPTTTFSFPAGTIITKSFGFANDLRLSSPGIRWVETRLLIRTEDQWKGYAYEWNSEQTEALLLLGGAVKPISFIGATGNSTTASYLIPSTAQCKECHANDGVMRLIGPKARNLNRAHRYSDGTENQLARWTRAGLLRGAPDPAFAAKLPVWNDPATGTTEARARAYLEVNCAHCHNGYGLAGPSGLVLSNDETNPAKYGVCKTTAAAAHGTGGFVFDIVPGDPDRSILLYRMRINTVGDLMPPLSRSLRDREGVALIREWIAGLSGRCGPGGT